MWIVVHLIFVNLSLHPHVHQVTTIGSDFEREAPAVKAHMMSVQEKCPQLSTLGKLQYRDTIPLHQIRGLMYGRCIPLELNQCRKRTAFVAWEVQLKANTPFLYIGQGLIYEGSVHNEKTILMLMIFVVLLCYLSSSKRKA